MKHFVTQATILGALIAAMLLAQVATGSARSLHHHHKRYVYYADADPAPYYSYYDYGGCRIGWWQGLYYGHVKPHWGTSCR